MHTEEPRRMNAAQPADVNDDIKMEEARKEGKEFTWNDKNQQWPLQDTNTNIILKCPFTDTAETIKQRFHAIMNES